MKAHVITLTTTITVFKHVMVIIFMFLRCRLTHRDGILIKGPAHITHLQ